MNKQLIANQHEQACDYSCKNTAANHELASFKACPHFSSQVPSPFLLKESATASIKLYYLSLERNKLSFASTLIRAHC